MINEVNDIIVGFDLGREHSQITFYSQRTPEPTTVSLEEGKDDYLMPTPKELFPLVEKQEELGITVLRDFIDTCIRRIPGADQGGRLSVMVTMERMEHPWTSVLPRVLHMLGIERNRVGLQAYTESFSCYMLNQKKELWNYKVGLFEYEDSRITAFELGIDYKTRPALVTVKRISSLNLDQKVQGRLGKDAWNEERDRLFLQMITRNFQNKTYSSVFLIGDNFNKTWAVHSLKYLGNRRHVFQGRNLYTKGACYAFMMRTGIQKVGNFLYVSDSMTEVNIGLQMNIRGKDSYYLCLNAGINWYEALHTCEFLLDDTDEVVIFTKPIDGSPAKSHCILLEELPKRPNKATRIQMKISFLSVHECRIELKDMGLGELFPSQGQTWEEILDV